MIVQVDTWLWTRDCTVIVQAYKQHGIHVRNMHMNTFFSVLPFFLLLSSYYIIVFLLFFFSFSNANSYFSSKSVYFLSFVNILFHHHEQTQSLGTRSTCKMRNTRARFKLRNMFLYSFFISFCSCCLTFSSLSLRPPPTHKRIYSPEYTYLHVRTHKLNKQRSEVSVCVKTHR